MRREWWRWVLLSIARQTPTYRAARLNRFWNLAPSNPGRRPLSMHLAAWFSLAAVVGIVAFVVLASA
jgi:hypothetical protein